MAETIVQAPVATEQREPMPAPLVPPDGTLDVLGQPRRLVGYDRDTRQKGNGMILKP
ncbi:hypothetical protein ACIQOF_24280 [Streptomyces sp. NPDC091265]|uniref:hypothetical protein n=1 Tax=unclassified Streptomyces TaxID=2593676 RepID=UPI00344DD650